MTAVVERALLAVLARSGDHRMQYLLDPVSKELATPVTSGDVFEAAWSLLSRGLVFIDPNGQTSWHNWNWAVTARGASVVEDEVEYQPEDPERYLSAIKSTVQDLDELVESYLQEALVAYEGRAFLASSVMLGVASERMFDLLATDFVGWLSGEEASAAAKAISDEKKNYVTRFREFRKRVEPKKPMLPNELSSNMTLNLDAVADLLRVNRNDAGHPTGRQISRDDAYVNLQVAARYVATIDRLRQFFRA
jgi:hypothetical protein